MSDKTVFTISDFSGPLDLLLFLIKKSEINIYDIPVAEITSQYLEILEKSPSDLDNMSEFYLMASTLLYIKSRTLLPVSVDLEEEAEDPRSDLVAKLIDYQKFRKISELMEKKFQKRELPPTTIRPKRQIFYKNDVWEEVGVNDLMASFKSLRNYRGSGKIVNITENVTINEKITLINELLESKEEFLFSELLKDENSTLEIVCAFLAILDSIKYRVIRVYQNKSYGDILLRKREDEE